jgi:hypothetical protein
MFLVGALLLAYGLLALLYGGEGRHPGSTYVRFGGHRLDAHLVGAVSLVISAAILATGIAITRRRSSRV